MTKDSPARELEDLRTELSGIEIEIEELEAEYTEVDINNCASRTNIRTNLAAAYDKRARIVRNIETMKRKFLVD